MTSIFLFGQSGRMGQQLQGLIDATDGCQVVGGYSKESSSLDLQDSVDVVIDFSLPETQKDLISFCEKKGCALVSGTTGLNKEQQNQFHSLAEKVPVFWSANMSFGVYLMSQLIEKLTGQKADYNYQIIETHHTHKKDAPSGTALLLEKSLNPGASTEPTQSIREGEVLGIHNFKATAPYETLEIIHTAKDRKLFASGALNIALWLHSQPPGLYSMADYFKKD